ncbi:TIGR03808 family TAT-translocated repetitive protein [Devosia sp.]|uniref:TIGR03808 family TAT-translocated repetitive protein n=1 Tax=Devosia sp. TaxID=1871048 RepID=UPI003264B4B9
MSTLSRPNRRTVLATGAAALALTQGVRAQSTLEASEFGVTANSGTDQTGAMQQALDQAGISGETLLLPAGEIQVSDLTFPAIIALQGSGAGSALTTAAGGRAGVISAANSASFNNIIFGGSSGGTLGGAIMEVNGSDGVSFERCQFTAGSTGLTIYDSAVTITNCVFGDHDDAAIHSNNSRGLTITGNRIAVCGNAGIRIWRDAPGPDGSIVTANHIATVDWRAGGSGENGNGINIFRADGVIIANNHISKCAFSAIRLNTTRNSQVSGNICMNSGECAIFSEFAFSGSMIANNIVDTAASGISITNLDQDGHLAVCSGNLVRNITPGSQTNPDTIPVGIYAEADTAVTGNTVDNVPGLAIGAGYGSYLRNVLISSNVVTNADYGIGVSVVQGCGPVQVANNLVASRKADLVGLEWTKVVSTDLAADAGKYPHVTVSGNS